MFYLNHAIVRYVVSSGARQIRIKINYQFLTNSNGEDPVSAIKEVLTSSKPRSYLYIYTYVLRYWNPFGRRCKVILENACIIVAMRELLEDPDWLPEAIARVVAMYDGLPGDKAYMLERCAPVRVIRSGQMVVEDEIVTIESGEASISLKKNDKVVVAQNTSPERGHASCIEIGSLSGDVSFIVIKLGDTAQQYT